jgi:hypothetical protein
MRATIPALAVTAFLLASNAAAPCEGDLRRSHTLNGYAFDTTSRVYNDGASLVYETCVKNHGSRTLAVNWYIPMLHSWIPAGESIPSPRYSSSPRPSSLRIDDGCLGYGNLEAPHRAQFYSSNGDSERLNCERQVGCLNVTRGQCRDSQVSSGINDRSDVIKRIFSISTWRRIFAPSSTGDPDGTMVQLDARVQIEPVEDGVMFRHALELYPESVGPRSRPERLKLLPALRILREAYSAKVLSLPRNEPYTVYLQTPSSARLREVQFLVLNGDNDHVATLLVPTWHSN